MTSLQAKGQDMATAPLGAVLQHIHSLAEERPDDHPSADAELLDAFLARSDQAAFGLILRRHGPMVLRVCRRVLGGLHDAEDVFQATFLFLAQQAGSVRKKASLASWLHGVALRMATNARRSAARRNKHERQAGPAPAKGDPAWQAAWHEVQSILDEEIQRLPTTYREPLVRCCLEHRSCAEAAAGMGLQEPTVRRRLSRARKLLEGRLSRRGVSLTLVSAALSVSSGRATAEVAPALLSTTAAAAAHLAAAQGLDNGMVSAKVIALLQGANQAMMFARIKTALVVFLGTLLLAGGTALVYGRGLPAGDPDDRPSETTASGRQAEGPSTAARSQPRKERTDHHGDPLPDEALARLGTTRFRPGEPVYFLRFTPDGTKLVTQSRSGLRVWDAATGRELRRFGPAVGISVFTADMTADGKLALTADSEQRGVLRLWDVGTGRQLRECGNTGGFGPVRLAPDGKTIAVRGPSGELELRHTATGECRHTLKGYDVRNRTATFSADSKTLVTGGVDKTIRLWDVTTGRERRRFDCPEVVGSVGISPDGKLLASVGVRKENRAQGIIALMPDNQVRIWDAATGKELRQLRVKAKSATQAGLVATAFTPDSKTLVTLGIDYVLRVWDATTGKELRSFSGCSTNSGALALTADGQSAAITSGGTTLRIIDLKTGKDRVPLPGHGGGVYAAIIAPDGQTIFTCGGDDSVCAWDAKTGKEVRRLAGHERWVSALALSPDGRSLYSLDASGKVQAWDTTTGKLKQQLAGDYVASSIGMMGLSADGKLLAAAAVKKSLVLIDASSGKAIRTVKGPEGQHYYGAAFTADGRTLVAWTDDQQVYVVDVATGKTRKKYPFAGDKDRRLSYAAALSPDGRLLAFGSQARFLSVLEVSTGEEVRRFDRLPDGVSSVAFSPDGRSLAWGGWNDPTVHLLELSTQGERHRFHGHQGRIVALHFSADGNVLISGGNDGTALVWDLTGRRDRKAGGDKDLSAEELASLWKNLGAADAPQAYTTICRLARSPAAVRFLATQIQPAAAPDEKLVASLIADLDSDDFQVRDRATKELERLGDRVAQACRKALAGRPSLEMRRRLETLLAREAGEAKQPSAERVRLLRALEALELAGTERARNVLAALARGATGAWLTEQARAGQDRLDRRRLTR
jgi:RNA polymerase sigma factor (sigma-70 family)